MRLARNQISNVSFLMLGVSKEIHWPISELYLIEGRHWPNMLWFYNLFFFFFGGESLILQLCPSKSEQWCKKKKTNFYLNNNTITNYFTIFLIINYWYEKFLLFSSEFTTNIIYILTNQHSSHQLFVKIVCSFWVLGQWVAG